MKVEKIQKQPEAGITAKSTVDDLIKKYSSLPEDVVKDIYKYNNKNVVAADFELKEMMFIPEPSIEKWEDYDIKKFDEKDDDSCDAQMETKPSSEEKDQEQTELEEPVFD